MRRGHPGPLTSAQVREGRRRAARSLPPAPPPDQVKRGSGPCGRRAARGGGPRARRPARGSSSCRAGARLRCPRRALRPPSGRRCALGTRGAAPGPRRVRGAVLPRRALVTPTLAPARGVQSCPEAAGRGAARPQQAPPALQSRPTAVPGLAGITVCTRVGACAWPQSGAESFPPLVTGRGGNRWWPAAGVRRRRGLPELL